LKPKGLFAVLPEVQIDNPLHPGVGGYQFVAITTLAPFGISKADALDFILVSQIW